MSFIAETGTGHLVAMDGAPDAGAQPGSTADGLLLAAPVAAPPSTSC